MKSIGYFLASIPLIALLIFAWVFVVAFVGLLFVIALLVWACGTPITIKQEGRVLGYVQWFTYYTEQDWLMHKYKRR